VSLIVERNEGLIDRTWVAGVNVTEIIIAQVVTQFFILLVQIILMVVIVVYAFKVSALDTFCLLGSRSCGGEEGKQTSSASYYWIHSMLSTKINGIVGNFP